MTELQNVTNSLNETEEQEQVTYDLTELRVDPIYIRLKFVFNNFPEKANNISYAFLYMFALLKVLLDRHKIVVGI